MNTDSEGAIESFRINNNNNNNNNSNKLIFYDLLLITKLTINSYLQLISRSKNYEVKALFTISFD